MWYQLGILQTNTLLHFYVLPLVKTVLMGLRREIRLPKRRSWCVSYQVFTSPVLGKCGWQQVCGRRRFPGMQTDTVQFPTDMVLSYDVGQWHSSVDGEKPKAYYGFPVRNFTSEKKLGESSEMPKVSTYLVRKMLVVSRKKKEKTCIRLKGICTSPFFFFWTNFSCQL